MTPSERELMHYLERPNMTPPPGTRAHWSTLWLALRDARVATGRNVTTGAIEAEDPPTHILGSVGYMVVLDQLGSAVRRLSRPSTSRSALLRSLESFSDLNLADRSTIYALRCALTHDYALVNQGRAGLHLFHLDWEEGRPLIEHPGSPWNGDFNEAPSADDTSVNLWAFVALVEQIVVEVREAHRHNDLELAVTAEEAENRFFVTMS